MVIAFDQTTGFFVELAQAGCKLRLDGMIEFRLVVHFEFEGLDRFFRELGPAGFPC